MNKFLSMAALALVGAVMASCSSDDDFANDNKYQSAKTGKIETLTTTIGLDGGTRALAADGKKTFAVGETMAVIYNNGTSFVKAVSHTLEAGDITNEGKNATFTFDLENPDKNGPVRYIYPAAMAGDTGVDLTKLNTQEGTFDALQSKYDFCTNSGAWDGDNLPSLTLPNQLAILAITLKNSDGSSDITSTITGLTLSDGPNTYNVNRSAVAGPIYVAIFPTEDATITVTATSGTKNYTKTLTTKTYEAGNGYPVSWRMAKAPATAYTLAESTVGMIVGSDGNAYAAADKDNLPSGVTAVAIVAYKGSETGEASPYNHGLAIAMKDAAAGGTVKWSSSSTDESQTNYDDPASAIAAKESGSALSSGRDNDSYPAFKAALANSITVSDGISAAAPASGTSGWFLPSLYQWNMIVKGLSGEIADLSSGTNYNYAASNLNTKIVAAGGTGLQSGRYWSSTEYDGSGAWFFHADYGSVGDRNKDQGYYVRSAFAF